MNKLNINMVYNGINVDTEFNTKLNILAGCSGTGKTLLLSVIDLYCLNNNITCRLCNYNDVNLAPHKIISICSDVDVALLDNADLYLTNDILQSIMKTAKFIIVSIKDTSSISTGDAAEYIVEYSNLSLKIKEI